MISGVKLDVETDIDENRHVHELKFSPEEKTAIDSQISELFEKKAIVYCDQESTQFFSNIFITEQF